MSSVRLLLNLISFHVVVTHSSDLSTIKYDFLFMMCWLLTLISFIIVDFELHWMLLS